MDPNKLPANTEYASAHFWVPDPTGLPGFGIPPIRFQHQQNDIQLIPKDPPISTEFMKHNPDQNGGFGAIQR